MKERRAKRRAHPLIEAASAYVGYTCKPGNLSSFGTQTGTNGLSWDGSFIDVLARDSGVLLPATVYTPAALARYIQTGRFFHVPKPGDIVFFAFPPGEDGELDAPHVGLVTDTTAWSKHRVFKTVEAQVNSGQPKGPQEHNGVYERVRHELDVIGFARPLLRKRRAFTNGHETLGVPVLAAHLTACMSPQKAAAASPEVRRSVEMIQIALSNEVGLRDADRGVFNPKTKAALAAFQRSIGQVNPTGMPDENTLRELANRQNPPFFHVP
jgi:hypothetical protein